MVLPRDLARESEAARSGPRARPLWPSHGW